MEDAVLESKTTELRSRQTGLLSAVEDGNPKSEKVLVFLAGFPDNEISAWGEVLETIRLSPQASTDYRILCLCLPDFEDSAVPKPWGWSITEIAEMLDNTINHYITSPSAQIYFVLHDWGSIFGLDYQNKYPLRVAKMVLFDVGMGMSKGQQPCPKFILVFYQWWWAFAYILSQLFCTCWGKCCFVSFSYLVSSCCQPTPADMAHHSRNARSVKIHMCYIYYQFWKDFFFTREKRLLYEFPTCPVLYMYGKMKNVMFHDDAFLSLVDSSPGSKQLAYDAGHWVTYGSSAPIVTKEIQEFFEISGHIGGSNII